MHKKWLILGLTSALMLAGCGSKNDANDHNFATALDHYLDDYGDLCLNVGAFPVDVPESDLRVQTNQPTGLAARMAALQRAGLVTSVDVALGEMGAVDDKPSGRRIRVRRYELTTAGRDTYRKIVSDQVVATGKTLTERSDLCYGKLAVNKVGDWDGPTQVEGREEAVVRYTYKLGQIADWAKLPAVQQAFPLVPNTLNGAEKLPLSTTLVLGEKGWIAKNP